jgi:uncharacterized damage-inducible protein DinB
MANHASHHRGQLTAFYRQLGAKPVTVDLLVFDRERAAKARS